MAKGRIISAKKLTEIDKKILEICGQISKIIERELDSNNQNDFRNEFGKIDYSRDAGLGLAGGKLQRDALCTPGKSTKDPISNRNLRWHPLVVAHQIPPGFNQCNVRVDDIQKTIFIITEDNEWIPEDVYKLPKSYCLTPKEWGPYNQILKDWQMKDWNSNNMIILASNYSPWYYALECFALLGIIVSTSIYNGNLDSIYQKVTDFLKTINIEKKVLPTDKFPSCDKNLTLCPICLSPLDQQPAFLPLADKPDMWRAPWKRRIKRPEASDLFTFHLEPQIESEVRHNAQNLRMGHRRCVIGKQDHSVASYIEYMKKVIEKYENT